jgi:hypothetical protein
MYDQSQVLNGQRADPLSRAVGWLDCRRAAMPKKDRLGCFLHDVEGLGFQLPRHHSREMFAFLRHHPIGASQARPPLGS